MGLIDAITLEQSQPSGDRFPKLRNFTKFVELKNSTNEILKKTMGAFH